MRNKLYIAGLIVLSALTYSCSNDESFEAPEAKSNNLKIVPHTYLKNKLNEKKIDSTTVNLKVEIINVDGDPSNPLPPRVN